MRDNLPETIFTDFSLITTEHPGISRAYRLTEYRYERKKHGKQIKDESTKEKKGAGMR